jgi:hypothetical protein
MVCSTATVAAGGQQQLVSARGGDRINLLLLL